MSDPKKGPPRAHILVVEDSAVFREMQALLLGQAGFAVSGFENPHAALAEAAKQTFELVVIDYELPDMNGQQFMHELRKIQPDIAVIFVSGSLTLELAVQLSSQGVAGIFNKPANPKTLLEKINETLARGAVRDTAARVGSGSPLPPARRGNSSSPFSPATPAAAPTADQLAYTPRFVLGASDAFRKFTHRAWKVRDFRAVLLLQGESGNPFELFARELAEISIFRDGPIMVCDAKDFEARRLIEVLAPSLLSHDAGTLMVTGVESLTADQQIVLQDLMGGRDVFLPFARRFRLVLAATNALSERVDEGTFNETLFYKISSLSLSVPSLREMSSDIFANATRILEQLGESESHPTGFTPDAAEWLETQEWPGNYEQLERTLRMAVRYADSPILTVAALEAGLNHEEESPRSTGSVQAQPKALADDNEEPNGEARPPFPLNSDLAKDAAPAVSLAAPVRVLTAKSLFRPASNSYNFGQRLSHTLSGAIAGATR